MSELFAVTEEEKDRALDQTMRNATVKKSNVIITSRYKATLLENQLTSICLSRVREQNGEYIATITASEIKRIFKKEKDSKIYKKLYIAANNMNGKTIAAEDGKGNFDIISVIIGAHYIDGVFSLEFNPKMKDYLFELKDKYTSYNLANVLDFKSEYSFRVYEICKMDAWMLSDAMPVNVAEYGLSELRCIIGDVDTSGRKLQAMMHADKPDWDKIVELAPNKSHERWDNFRRQVLDIAKKEINEQSDICIDYKPVKSGKGAKVVKVKFFIKRNEENKNSISVQKNMKNVENLNKEYEKKLYSPSPELLKYIDHNKLKIKDLNLFLTDAAGDNELVIKAIKMADEQPNIQKYVGWIRNCIRNNCFEKPIHTISGSAEKGEVVDNAKDDIANNEEQYLERYWKKAKRENTEAFVNFCDYLSQHKIGGKQLNLKVFESNHKPPECGDLFMRWVTGEDIELI